MSKSTRQDLANQTVALVIEGPRGSGQGSGILVSLEGLGLKEGAKIPRAQGPDMVLKNDDVLIVTCEHCIPRGSRSMKVQLRDGSRMTADALVVDGRADVALMKIRDFSWDSANGYTNTHGLKPVKVGTSADVTQGDDVLAVGAPLMEEYRFSMTDGIISKEKAFNPLSILPTFLTSAQINPGNSGGLLALKETGEWIGMNSSGLFGEGGGNRGLNHAIRVDEILFWIKRMIINKQVVRDGITSLKFLMMNDALGNKVGLEVNHGAFIAAIEDDDPGVGKALKLADVVQSVTIMFNGKPYKKIVVEKPEDCIFAFQHAAGQDVEVEVWRNGQQVIEAFKVEKELLPFSNQASFDPFGMEVQTYRGNQGVQVTNVHPMCPLAGYVNRYSVINGIEDPNDPSNVIDVTDHKSFYQTAAAHGQNMFFVRLKDAQVILPLQQVQAAAAFDEDEDNDPFGLKDQFGPEHGYDDYPFDDGDGGNFFFDYHIKWN